MNKSGGVLSKSRRVLNVSIKVLNKPRRAMKSHKSKGALEQVWKNSEHLEESSTSPENVAASPTTGISNLYKVTPILEAGGPDHSTINKL